MDIRQAELLARELAPVIREHIASAFAPVLQRLNEVELRVKELPSPPDAEQIAAVARAEAEQVVLALPQPAEPIGDPDLNERIAAQIDKAVAGLAPPERGERGEQGEPGQSVDPAEVERTLADMVAAAFATMRVPQDGQDGKDADPEKIAEMIGDAVERRLADGQKTLTAEQVVEIVAAAFPEPTVPTPEEIRQLVAAEIEDAVKSLAVPADGHSPTHEELAPLIETIVSRHVEARPVAKDGVGLAGGLIDQDGVLILTSTDGAIHRLGRVVGTDGRDGETPAVKELDPAEIAEIARAEIAKAMLPAADTVDEIPDELAQMVSRAAAMIAEAPPIQQAKASEPAPQPIVVNVASARKILRKTVTTRRDADGNLVGDIVEEVE